MSEELTTCMDNVDKEYTRRFAAGYKKVAEGILVMSRVATEVRAEYGYEQFVLWLDAKFGLSRRTGDSLLNIYRNLIMGDYGKFCRNGSEVNWSRFAASALYLLASPSTPAEAIIETVEMSDNGEDVSYAVARGVVKRVKRMNAVLGRVSPEIMNFVKSQEIDDPDVVETLERLERSSTRPGSNGTYDEIIRTGGFHYGENCEQWCDFVDASPTERVKALDSLSRAHRKLTPSSRDIAVNELVNAARGLVRFRSGLQDDEYLRVQDADEHIERLRCALRALGE